MSKKNPELKNTNPNFFRWENPDAGNFPFLDQVRNAKPVFWAKLALLLVISVFALIAIDLNVNAIANWLISIHIPHFLAGLVAIIAFPLTLFLPAWLLFKDEIKTLFKPLKRGTFKLVILCVLAYLVYATAINLLLNAIGMPTTADKAFSNATGEAKVLESLGFLIQLPFQLFGEELFAIFWFLAGLCIFYGLFKFDRKKSIIFALLLSCIVFGLAHYQAYDWNLAQMLLIIGASRVFMTFAYLKTKNIFASFLVHFTFDGGTVLLGLLVALASLV